MPPSLSIRIGAEFDAGQKGGSRSSRVVLHRTLRRSFYLLVDAHLGRGFAEAAGEPSQQHDADHQPDHAEDDGATVQSRQQVKVDNRSREWKRNPSEYRENTTLGPMAQEVRDHAEVDQRERGKGTEVDE